LKPPKYAQKNAQKALDCLQKGSEAMTKTGRNRAKQLAKGENLTIGDLKSIHSFRRHKSNAKYSGPICEDKGAVAWLGWGYGHDNGKPKERFGDWAKTKLRKVNHPSLK